MSTARKALSCVMSVVMTVSLMPLPAFAADGAPAGGSNASASSGSDLSAAGGNGATAESGNDASAAGESGTQLSGGLAGASVPGGLEAADPVANTPAFSQSVDVDGVTITVTAPEGAFPADATLSAAKVEALTDAQAQAVDNARPDNQNVAASYSFDIKVLGADGQELQPADGKKADVAFAMTEVTDPNLKAGVYHHAASEAEALVVTEEAVDGKDVVSAETNGFSVYTVEFTYGDLQYVLRGGGSVPLATILGAVGLTGDVTSAKSDAPELFSVEQVDGTWIVTSKQSFETPQSLAVTIGGVEYTIDVTDPISTGDTIRIHNSGSTAVTVYFDLNGGSGTVSPVTVAAGGDGSAPADGAGLTPPEGAYRFAGWSEVRGDYKNIKNAVRDDTIDVSATKTLYALWDELPDAEYNEGYYDLFTSADFGDNLVTLTDNGSGWTLSAFATSATSPKKIYIRGEWNGKKITKIAANTFEGSGITTVKFADGCELVEIGARAFYGLTGLTGLTLPTTLQTVGADAFNGCTGIRTVNFTELTELSSIGQASFAGTRISPLDLSQTKLTVLPYNAFANSPAVRTIALPEGLTTLGAFSLSALSNAAPLVIPSSVTSIGEVLLNNCQGGCMVDLRNAQHDTILQFCRTNMTYAGSGGVGNYDYIFPDSWYDNSTNFVFDKETGLIAGLKGGHNDGLVDVHIPEAIDGVRVAEFANMTFSNWNSQHRINTFVMDSGCDVTELPANALSRQSKMTKLVLSENITNIKGNYQFWSARSLTEVELPKRLTTIEGAAPFLETPSLKSLTFPRTLRSAGSSRLGEWSLEELTIGDEFGSNLTSMNPTGLQSSKDLKVINIPGLTKAEGQALGAPWTNAPWGAVNAVVRWKDVEDQPSLTEVVAADMSHWTWDSASNRLLGFMYSGTDPETGNYGHDAANPIGSLTLPTEVYLVSDTARANPLEVKSIRAGILAQRDASDTGTTENVYVENLIIPAEFINSFGEYIAGSRTYLKNVTLGDGAKEVWDNYFDGTPKTTDWPCSINLPEGLTKIHYQSLTGCTLRTKLPSSLTHIYDRGLVNVKTSEMYDPGDGNVENILEIPRSVTYIENNQAINASVDTVRIQRYAAVDAANPLRPAGDNVAPEAWSLFGAKYILLTIPHVEFAVVGQYADLVEQNIKVVVRAKLVNGEGASQSTLENILNEAGDGTTVATLTSKPSYWDSMEFEKAEYKDEFDRTTYGFAEFVISKEGKYNALIRSKSASGVVSTDKVAMDIVLNYGYVKFHAAGGEGTLPDDQTLLAGTSYSIPAVPADLACAGYKHPSAWVDAETGGTAWNPGTTYTIQKNVTLHLYPVWEVDDSIKTKVHYQAGSNGTLERGDESSPTISDEFEDQVPTAVSLDATSSLVETRAKPATGYHSIGWSLTGSSTQPSTDGTLTPSEVASSVPVKESKSREECTYTALFRANDYKIVFDANTDESYTGTTRDLEMIYNVPDTAPRCGFNATTQAFLHWNTKADGTGTSYERGDELKNLTDVQNGTVTLYAIWADAVEIGLTGGSTSASYTGSDIFVGESDGIWTLTYKVRGEVVASLPAGFKVEFTATQDGAAVDPAGVRGKDVGTYTSVVKATLSGEAAGYAIKSPNADGTASTSASVKLTVTPRPITVVADDQQKSYGDDDPELTCTVSGVVPGEEVVVGATRDAGEEVKSSGYAIRPDLTKFEEDYPNYTIQSATNGKLVIDKREITLALADDEKTYGTNDPDWTTWPTKTGNVTLVAGGVTKDDKMVLPFDEQISDLSFTVKRDKGNDVGDYAITLVSGSNKNYIIYADDSVFTIKPGASDALNLDAEGGEWVYDGKAHAVTASVDIQRDTTILYSTDYNATTGTGKWVDTAPSLTDVLYNGTTVAAQTVYVKAQNPNYEETAVKTVTLKVTPKPATVKPKDASKVYGDIDPELTASVTGAVAGEEIVYTLSRATGEDAGTYDITATMAANSNPNYTVTAQTGKFTITKAKATVTVNDATKVYGEADPTFTYDVAGLVGSETLVGSVTRPAGENVARYALTFTPTAGGNANKNYDIKVVNGALTITKKDVYITAEDKTKEYGVAADPELTAKVEGEVTVPGASTPTKAVYTLSRRAGEDVGEYAISVAASAADNPNYNLNIEKGTFRITPKAATITPVEASKTYGASDPTLTATVEGTKEGDTLVYTLSRAQGENVGKYDIIVTLGSNPNYTVTVPANSGKEKFEITKKDVTLTAADKAKTYGDADPELTAKATGLVGGDTLEYTLSRAAGEDVGEYAINVTLGSNPNYNVSVEGTAKLTINKKSATVKADDATKVYGEADPTLTATVTGTVGTDALTYTVERATGENVGSYDITVTAKAEDNKNYDVKVLPGRFTITKKDLVLTAEDKSMTYGETAPALTVVPDGLVAGDALTDIDYTASCRVTDATSPAKDAGQYPISITAPATATDKKNGNYNISVVKGTFTINPKAVTVRPDADQTKVYGANDPNLTAKVFVGDAEYTPAAGYDAVDYAVTRSVGEDVGSYTITVTPGSNPNYTVKVEKGTFTITAAEASGLNLVAVGYEGVYDGSAHAAGYTVDVSQGTVITYTEEYDPENPDAAVWTANPPTQINAGTKNFWVKATNKNYAPAIASGELVVTKKAVTVKADNKTMVFGEDVPELTATVTGNVNNDAITYTVKTPDVSTIGEKALVVEGAENQGNYTVTFVPGTLKVLAAPATEIGLIVESFDGIYDASAHGVTASVDVSSGTTITYSIDGGETWVAADAAKFTNAGSYTVKVKAENPNYKTQTVTGKVTIAKKDATVWANDAGKVYGEDDPALTATTVGAVAGQELAFTLSRKAGEDAGDYAISVSPSESADVNKNYNISTEKGVFTINPKPISIEPKAAEKTYGASDPAFELEAFEGLVGSDELNYTVTRAAGENVGTYRMFVNLGSNPNYKVTAGKNTFTIKVKEVTITPDAKTKVYGDADPALTAKVTGAVAGENIDYTLQRAEGEDVDTYTISTVLTEGANTNYKVNATATADFVITKRLATVKADDATKVYGDADPELTATVTGTVGTETLTYTVSRAEGDVVGTYDITPSAEADDNPNYNVTFQKGTFTITKKTATVTALDAAKTYGEVDPNWLDDVQNKVEVTGTVGDDTLNIASLMRKAGENAGDYALKVVMGENPNYNVVTIDGTFTINKRNATVTANDAEKTYAYPAAPDPELTATVEGEAESVPDGYQYDKVDYTVTRTAGENVGTYVITVTPGSNPNYNVKVGKGTFTIKKGGQEGESDLVITVHNVKEVYDGVGHAFSADVNYPLGTTVLYSTDGENWTANAPSQKDVTAEAGVKVQVRATNPNYYDATAEGSMIVTPRPVTVTANNKSMTYGDNPPELTASVEGAVFGETIDYTLATEATDAKYVVKTNDDGTVGSYPITVTPTEDKNKNYTVTTAEGSFTVNPKPITVSADGKTKVYGDDDPALTATVTGLVEGDALNVEGAEPDYMLVRAEGEDVGNYDITVTATETWNKNYKLNSEVGKFVITPAQLTVTASDATSMYNGEEPEAPTEFTVSGLKNGDTKEGLVDEGKLVVKLTKDAGVNAGTYLIVASGDPVQGNYNVAYVNGVYTITKSTDTEALKPKIDDLVDGKVSYVYDASTHVVTATEGIHEGTTVYYSTDDGTTWTTTEPGRIFVGQTPVLAKAVNPNYVQEESDVVSLVLEITPRPVTITADEATMVYHGDEPVMTATVSGVLNNDELEYTVVRDMTLEDVGEYEGAMTVVLPTDDEGIPRTLQGNYEITNLVAGKLIIVKADASELGLKAKGYEGVYDAGTHAASAFVLLTEGTTIEYSTDQGKTWSKEAPSIKDAGKQQVEVRATNPNYNTQTTEVSLVVTRAPAVVRALSAEKVYGEKDPAFKATVTGTFNNDQLKYSFVRQPGESVGSYTINVDGEAVQGNYDVTYKTGLFAITQAEAAVLTLSGGYTGVYDGESHTVAAVVSVPEGTTLYYKERGSGWTTNAPSIKNVGKRTVGIRAVNPNYKTAQGTMVLEVTKAKLTVTALNASITYGDAPTNNGVRFSKFAGAEDASALGGKLAYDYSYTRYGNVGEYSITPKGLSSANYDITFVPGKLTVGQKKLGLKWADNLTYTGMKQTYSGAKLVGLVHGDALSAKYTGAKSAKNAGKYKVTVSKLTGKAAKNYALPKGVSHTWKIAKAANKWTSKAGIASWAANAKASSAAGAAKFGKVKYEYKLKGASSSTYTTTKPKTAGRYTVRATVAATKNYTGLKATKSFRVYAAPMLMHQAKATDSSITFKWNKVAGATSYAVYASPCDTKDKSHTPRYRVVTNKTSFTLSKIGEFDLEPGTYYKAYVVALDSSARVLSKSLVTHVSTTGGTHLHGNYTSVKLSSPSDGNLTLKVGGAAKQIRANAIGTNVGKHVGMRFQSSDPSVATVTGIGFVKAKKAGTCTVYAIAQNGVSAAVEVTVE